MGAGLLTVFLDGLLPGFQLCAENHIIFKIHIVSLIVSVDSYIAFSEYIQFHISDISPLDVHVVKPLGFLAIFKNPYVVEADAILGQRNSVVAVPELGVSQQQR